MLWKGGNVMERRECYGKGVMLRKGDGCYGKRRECYGKGGMLWKGGNVMEKVAMLC